MDAQQCERSQTYVAGDRKLKGLMTTVLMDSEADDRALAFQTQRQHMSKVLTQRKHKRLYKQKS